MSLAILIIYTHFNNKQLIVTLNINILHYIAKSECHLFSAVITSGRQIVSNSCVAATENDTATRALIAIANLTASGDRTASALPNRVKFF
jgi:hypothetical protein